MLDFIGVMTNHIRFLATIFDLSAILKQSKIQLGSKLTVAYILELNCAKFKRNQRCAFKSVFSS
jgi:hypothetical protein